VLDPDATTSGVSCRLWNSDRTVVPERRQRVDQGVQQRRLSVLQPAVPHVHRHDADCPHMSVSCQLLPRPMSLCFRLCLFLCWLVY